MAEQLQTNFMLSGAIPTVHQNFCLGLVSLPIPCNDVNFLPINGLRVKQFLLQVVNQEQVTKIVSISSCSLPSSRSILCHPCHVHVHLITVDMKELLQ